MSAQPSASSPFRGLRDFLASVRLTFFLLVVLAVASVAGTLLPQKEPAAHYLQDLGPLLGGVALRLGLDDLFHAGWYRLLLLALALNLVVCSLTRLPQTLKIVRKDPAQDLARFPSGGREFLAALAPGEALTRAEAWLGRRLGRVHRRQEEGGKTVLFAQRGAKSRLGVYLVHASVLVIFAGAMVGNLVGFSGYLALGEGETLSAIQESGSEEPRELGFALRLDKFTVSYYEGGLPKEYRSDVVFLQDGREVGRTAILVNHPASFGGVDFYQSSYGQKVDRLTVLQRRGEATARVDLFHRRWSELPLGGRAGVMEYRDEVRMGGMYQGPLARLLYQEGEDAEPVGVNAFKAGAKLPVRGPVGFEIVEAFTKPYTGLQVKYDPGVPLVWLGCGMMVLGFLATFYLSHRKVWVRIAAAPGGGARVELAATANKNRAGLERLLAGLDRELAGRPSGRV